MQDELTHKIINAAICVHGELGPGLLESVYEEVLSYELRQMGLGIKRQYPVPVYYNELKMEIGFRADLIVENEVIVEIKSVESLLPVFKKQVLNYLKLTGLKTGLLINFNQELLKDGLVRLYNKYY